MVFSASLFLMMHIAHSMLQIVKCGHCTLHTAQWTLYTFMIIWRWESMITMLLSSGPWSSSTTLLTPVRGFSGNLLCLVNIAKMPDQGYLVSISLLVAAVGGRYLPLYLYWNCWAQHLQIAYWETFFEQKHLIQSGFFLRPCIMLNCPLPKFEEFVMGLDLVRLVGGGAEKTPPCRSQV